MKKIILLILIIICSGCDSNEIIEGDESNEKCNEECGEDGNEVNIQLPTLTTNTVTNILSSSIICGGNISDDGGAEIITRGVCWDINKKPTLNNSVKFNGIGIGAYSDKISNLKDDTSYYLRAFATNKLGTSYGNELSFTTLKKITYEVVLFEFTPDTGNNTNRLQYEIKFNNLNSVPIQGFYKVALSVDGFVSSRTSRISCSEIDANASCSLIFDEEESFDLGMINTIELVSAEYLYEH